jgi:ankyrin repeat protein
MSLAVCEAPRMVKDGSESAFQPHPISAAAANGHMGIALKLLEHGADVDFKHIDGRSPLSLAARGGHIDTVRALVGRGANVLSLDMDGHRAITNAASEGNHGIEDHLLALLGTKRPPLKRTMKTEMHFMRLKPLQKVMKIALKCSFSVALRSIPSYQFTATPPSVQRSGAAPRSARLDSALKAARTRARPFPAKDTGQSAGCHNQLIMRPCRRLSNARTATRSSRC